MRQRQRMLKCAVLAALFVLGGACTKINAPAANARQTHEAVMAAASAADNTTISTTETTAKRQMPWRRSCRLWCSRATSW